jgi:hypothetical protein
MRIIHLESILFGMSLLYSKYFEIFLWWGLFCEINRLDKAVLHVDKITEMMSS